MSKYICPECEEELDHLDAILKWLTAHDQVKLYDLWICHNEDCIAYGQIWNDQLDQLSSGDPSGCY